MEVSQYDIIIVNLDPTAGSEIRKTRPCVAISPDELNRHLNTIVIAPITSQSKNYPTRLKIMLEKKINWVVVDQIRTIDKTRIIKKISELSKSDILELKLIIRKTYVD
jgi:mRNA interferase MazF